MAVVAMLVGSCNSETDYLVTIETPYGDMKAILYDETPQHKENFIKLIKAGFYDSLLFHRVMNEFMIQGGDPLSKNATPGSPLGTGGPGYTVPAEFLKHLIHEKGALAAARQPDNMNPEKASSGSQFYVVHGKVWTENELTTDMNKLGMAARQMMADPQYDSIKQVLFKVYEEEGGNAYGSKLVEIREYIENAMGIDASKDFPADRLEVYTTKGGSYHLDDEYTVFGKVIDGLEVIDKIAEQPTDRRDRPTNDIPMVISVEEVKKKEITKLYGYEYPAQEEE